MDFSRKGAKPPGSRCGSSLRFLCSFASLREKITLLSLTNYVDASQFFASLAVCPDRMVGGAGPNTCAITETARGRHSRLHRTRPDGRDGLRQAGEVCKQPDCERFRIASRPQATCDSEFRTDHRRQ